MSQVSFGILYLSLGSIVATIGILLIADAIKDRPAPLVAIHYASESSNMQRLAAEGNGDEVR